MSTSPTFTRSMMDMVETYKAGLTEDDHPGYRGHLDVMRAHLWALDALDKLPPLKLDV